MPALALVALPAIPAAGAALPRNPYLANSPNNQSHWNDAATDSTEAAVPTGHYCLTPGSFAIAWSDALGIPAYGAEVGGKRVYWFFSGTALRKLHFREGAWVEIARQPVRMDLPGYSPLPDHERERQALALRDLLLSGDEPAIGRMIEAQPNRLQTAVEDQVAQGVLYSLFTRDHGFIGANARGLLRIDNLDQADPFSGLSAPIQTSLPADLFDDQRVKSATIFPADSVFGLGMTFNGYLVISTLGGTIATVDRETFTVIDRYRAPDGEVFTNSFATSAELDGGAVYIASNRHMYRMRIGSDGRIRTDEASGAWFAAYDPGKRLPTGKIADGTGATPTLMGFGPGEDQLVVLTDGARQMRLVAFWRDGIPKGWRQRKGTLSPRIADQITVDFGPEFPVVQSEQSVVAVAGHAFVINSILSGGARPMPTRGSFVRGLLAGTVRPLPKGIGMYRWDQRNDRWQVRWTRTDVGTIATVPMLSRGSEMVVVNGTLDRHPGKLFHLGFDLASGETKMSINSGTDPRFNGAFTGIKSDDDGTLMYTTLFGLVRFDVGQMTRVTSPDSADYRCTPSG
ncbi:MAG: hypothetical protein KJZ64_05140 [Sphingomonadaceae bacterium]|nr:hypothetical protein [Sphingomonadaceae bacterium]